MTAAAARATAALCLLLAAGCDDDPAPRAESAEDRVLRYLADATIISRDGGGTTEVVYRSATGEAYLWRPGRVFALRSGWRVAPSRDGADPLLCRAPFPAGPGPDAGADPGCTPAASALGGVVERVAGDPFGLADGTVPFPLRAGRRYTAVDLIRKAGGDPGEDL